MPKNKSKEEEGEPSKKETKVKDSSTQEWVVEEIVQVT